MAEQTEPASIKKPRVALWIATGFGLGYLPVAPGTWGSLGGVLLAWFLSNFWYALTSLNSFASAAWRTYILKQEVAILKEEIVFVNQWVEAAFMWLPSLLGGLVVACVGVWASRHAARYLGKSDPGQVVIDEISGQQITYLPLGALSFAGGGWKYVLLGFILFRIFDIVKPWPARAAEKWPHGWGIMADDWIAGIYAAVLLWFVQRMNWLG